MKMAVWNIRSLCKTSRQKEVREFIKEEEVCFCSVLETHLKGIKVSSVAKKIFGQWEWSSNSDLCVRGCIILSGWNRDIVNVMIITQSDQTVQYFVKEVHGD